MTSMKTAVIMSRVSSEEQAQGYSLGVQEESLTRYCEKNNIEIVQKFREDHSAKDFNRPEFKAFLNYARKNKGKMGLTGERAAWARPKNEAEDGV